MRLSANIHCGVQLMVDNCFEKHQNTLKEERRPFGIADGYTGEGPGNRNYPYVYPGNTFQLQIIVPDAVLAEQTKDVEEMKRTKQWKPYKKFTLKVKGKGRASTDEEEEEDVRLDEDFGHKLGDVVFNKGEPIQETPAPAWWSELNTLQHYNSSLHKSNVPCLLWVYDPANPIKVRFISHSDN